MIRTPKLTMKQRKAMRAAAHANALDVYDRIMQELADRGLDVKWFAKQLGGTVNRVLNWKVRGVPESKYKAIAIALDKPIDWVAGLIDLPRSEELVLTDFERNLILFMRGEAARQFTPPAQDAMVEREFHVERRVMDRRKRVG